MEERGVGGLWMIRQGMSFEAALETESFGSTLYLKSRSIWLPGQFYIAGSIQISKIIIQDNSGLPTVECRSCFQRQCSPLLCNATTYLCRRYVFRPCFCIF